MIKLGDTKYKLDVDSDLSTYAYIKAEEWIRGQLDQDYQQKLCFSLSVPSQTMSDACKMAFCLNITNVQIDFNYNADEWSVTGYYYDRDFNKVELTIWSPGA